MRRAENDLIAISPPPEFQNQDVPSNPSSSSGFVVTNSSLVVQLPPPPQDFRDLTPSPGGYGDPLLTFGLTPHTLLPLQSFHHGRTFVRKIIWDFADRVSSNIVNEAVVIATVLPEAGSGKVADFRVSSNLYEKNALSSSTSWEYLPPPSKLPQVRKHVKSKAIYKSDIAFSHNTNITPLKYSSKRYSEDIEDIHFVIVKNEHPVSSKAREMLETQVTEIGQSLRLFDQEPFHVCQKIPVYKVPYQCDIYSLPLDSITPHATTSSSLETGTKFPVPQAPFCRNRSRTHKGRELNSKRHSIQVVERNDPTTTLIDQCSGNCGGSGFARKVRNSERRRNSTCDEDTNSAQNEDEFNTPIFPRREKNNNNNENVLDKVVQLESIATTSNSFQIQKRSSHILGGGNPGLMIETEKDGGSGKEKKNIGLTFLNLFRRSRQKNKILQCSNENEIQTSRSSVPVACRLVNARALPSPPRLSDIGDPGIGFQRVQVDMTMSLLGQDEVVPGDFAASLEKVKDCGWYWGPLSSEGAEDLLRGEPDGSFIVRDSSDARYIFSLTFKLNGLIRHVRIEHDQGNFSFGPLTRFKASTIVDFVEKAVAHSRSGRYLFFLHRRPVLGPMRVQLLHPYSRFRHPRSLQHMCRFVILKSVRRDLVESLGLPKLLLDYLNASQYYFESPEV